MSNRDIDPKLISFVMFIGVIDKKMNQYSNKIYINLSYTEYHKPLYQPNTNPISIFKPGPETFI